jgi:hypothetical protein
MGIVLSEVAFIYIIGWDYMFKSSNGTLSYPTNPFNLIRKEYRDRVRNHIPRNDLLRISDQVQKTA